MSDNIRKDSMLGPRPSDEDPRARLWDIMTFFRHGIRVDNKYSGTVVFDLGTSDQIFSVRVHANKPVEIWFGLPPDKQYSAFVNMTRDDFLYVYSGECNAATLASMILTGKVRVRWLRYLEVQSFALAFDYSVPNWISYFRKQGNFEAADSLLCKEWEKLISTSAGMKGLVVVAEDGTILNCANLSHSRILALREMGSVYLRGGSTVEALAAANEVDTTDDIDEDIILYTSEDINMNNTADSYTDQLENNTSTEILSDDWLETHMTASTSTNSLNILIPDICKVIQHPDLLNISTTSMALIEKETDFATLLSIMLNERQDEQITMYNSSLASTFFTNTGLKSIHSLLEVMFKHRENEDCLLHVRMAQLFNRIALTTNDKARHAAASLSIMNAPTNIPTKEIKNTITNNGWLQQVSSLATDFATPVLQQASQVYNSIPSVDIFSTNSQISPQTSPPSQSAKIHQLLTVTLEAENQLRFSLRAFCTGRLLTMQHGILSSFFSISPFGAILRGSNEGMPVRGRVGAADSLLRFAPVLTTQILRARSTAIRQKIEQQSEKHQINHNMALNISILPRSWIAWLEMDTAVRQNISTLSLSNSFLPLHTRDALASVKLEGGIVEQILLYNRTLICGLELPHVLVSNNVTDHQLLNKSNIDFTAKPWNESVTWIGGKLKDIAQIQLPFSISSNLFSFTAHASAAEITNTLDIEQALGESLIDDKQIIFEDEETDEPATASARALEAYLKELHPRVEVALRAPTRTASENLVPLQNMYRWFHPFLPIPFLLQNKYSLESASNLEKLFGCWSNIPLLSPFTHVSSSTSDIKSVHSLHRQHPVSAFASACLFGTNESQQIVPSVVSETVMRILGASFPYYSSFNSPLSLALEGVHTCGSNETKTYQTRLIPILNKEKLQFFPSRRRLLSKSTSSSNYSLYTGLGAGIFQDASIANLRLSLHNNNKDLLNENEMNALHTIQEPSVFSKNHLFRKVVQNSNNITLSIGSSFSPPLLCIQFPKLYPEVLSASRYSYADFENEVDQHGFFLEDTFRLPTSFPQMVQLVNTPNTFFNWFRVTKALFTGQSH
jgi:hypothetical protein